MVTAETQKTGAFNVLVGKTDEILQNAIGAPLRYLVNWGRLYSLWPVHLETACCSVEVGAAGGARFDMERFGVLEAFGSLRQCDLLIVMGTVTRKLAPRLKLIYDQMPEPKWTVAMGACERGDALVYTPRGLVRIDEIDPGDTVYAYDEQLKQVTRSHVMARKANGVRENYRVRAGSYESVATDDHPFAVYEKTISRRWVAYQSMLGMVEEGFTHREIAPLLGTSPKTLSYWKSHPPAKLGMDIVWKPLHQVVEGDLLCVFAGPAEETSYEIAYEHQGRIRKIVQIPASVDDRLAWLTGLYLGDGWNSNGTVGFSLLPHDLTRPTLIKTIRDLFGTEPAAERQVLVRSKVVAEMFKRSLRLEGDLYTKRVPSWVYNLPMASLLSFLTGFIEADGYVQKEGFASISSANRDLISDILELCHFRGVHAGGIFVKEKESLLEGRLLKSTEYIVTFPYSVVSRLPMHRPDYQRRVHRAQREFNGLSALQTNHAGIGLQRVTSVIQRERAEVYDIEVAGHHNFFANGQLVHNCSITGGLYFDSYNVLRGIDDIIPVDVYIPGCPPRAEAFLQGMILLQEKIRRSPSIGGR